MTGTIETTRFYVKASSPFKWVGSKRRLLPTLLSLMPKDWSGRYFEPFAGGASLFFALQPERSSLWDMNYALVRTYQALRDHAPVLRRHLRQYEESHRKKGDKFYYDMRDELNASLRRLRFYPSFNPAARRDPRCSYGRFGAIFMYLNKTGFNGLCRFNRDGEYNVPSGRYADPAIYRPEILLETTAALQNASIEYRDFRRLVHSAKRGDFVYFDPPYTPASATANFTGYTKSGFSEMDQRDLCSVFTRLATRGVHCMLSNSDTPLIRELYDERRFHRSGRFPEFNVTRIAAPRSVSCKGDGRGSARELVIRSYA